MKSRVNLILLLTTALIVFFGGCKNQILSVDKSKMPAADSPYAKVHLSKSG